MAKTSFSDGDVQSKTGGTRVMAAFLNLIFRHRHDGRNQDGSAPLDFSVDTGAVNTVVVGVAPALDALIVGMPLYVQVAHTNTNAVTVTVDGFGPHPLHKLGGVDLVAGDIQATQIVHIAWDGTIFQLISYNSPPVTDAATLGGQTAVQLVPPGALLPFAMPSVPGGWLLCDGRAVLRATYPALYAAVGTTWGAGDGVSTFNLPDLRGEFLRGWDDARGVDAGRSFGSFQQDQLQNITATFQADDRAATGTGAIQQEDIGDFGSTGTGSGYTMSFDASRVVRTGTETRPRNIAVLYCIKY